MNAFFDASGSARPTIVGIQLGEVVKVTQHPHGQHSWQNPFERRRATSLPEDLVLQRPVNPSSLREGDSELESAEAAACKE